MTTDPARSRYIFDPESPTEMARLINQDRFLTKVMGGALVGIADPSALHTVLDLACGPGGWALDVAFAYPHMEVAGVDISQTMIAYANARARSQQLKNVSFGVMDITRPLDLTESGFDLVNARFLFAVLLSNAWEPFLSECFRLLKPGGILRLTEPVHVVSTGESTQKQWMTLYRFLSLVGYGFSPGGGTTGVTPALPRLLRTVGYTEIRHLTHVQDFSQGSEYWSDGYRNQEVLGQTMLPLFVKKGLITQDEATDLHRQAMIEWLDEDFCGMSYFHTILATKP